MSQGRAHYQKWRGRNQSRGQHRFNKWDRTTGSDNFTENNRKPGRRQIVPEEEEMLDMDPGVEMTNLKVKIQDGKRFAAPEEFDTDLTAGRKNYSKFSRGRGSRGYHGAGRDRWTQGNKFKPQPDELVDCREVLNRRKRHIPDQSESDLREKLSKKDPDLGDLREIIESRDHCAGDLRALIDEPPDISLMDEYADDITEDIDLQEDINIQNEYFDEVHSEVNDNSEREFPVEDFNVNDRYQFDEVPDVGGISPRGGLHHRDVVIRDQDDWHQRRWQRSRSRERSFGQAEGWAARNRRAENWRRNQQHKEGPDQRTLTREISTHPRSRSRDLSRNRSRERVRSPSGRNFRESRGNSFDRGVRLRGPSWERERSFGSVSSRSRGINIERGRRGSFQRDVRRINEEGPGRRPFPPELNDVPSPGGDRRQLRSPLLDPGRRERSIERDGTGRQHRSISQDVLRTIGRDRSRSHDRRFRRGSQEGHQNRRSISAERGRMLSQERNQERGVGRERDRKRSPHQESNWSSNRVMNREIGQEGIRNFEQERSRHFNQERDRNFDQERSRNFNQERNRNFNQERNMAFDEERNKSFNQERNKKFVKENKRSIDRELGRVTRWDSGNSRDRSPRADSGANLGRERIRSPNWGGPRTPSAESYREPGWDGAKSPARERSRSRGRPGLQPGHSRDDSRGRETEGRIREQRDRGALRAKEPERRDQTQDLNRRNQDGPLNRPRDLVKESVAKMEKNRKREQEDTTNKDRGRGILRSPDRRNQDKIIKKTPQMLVEEFKQRYVRESGKVEKYDRREEYLLKQGQGKDTVGQQRKLSGGQEDSREWENIRDFQERRNAQTIVGLPFLDESRRPRDSSSHNQHSRSQPNRGERIQGKTDAHLHGNQARLSSTVHHQIKDTPMNWQNQDNRQTFNQQEEDRSRSRWGSPSRRDKSSDHRDGHKSAPYATQSATTIHQSSSNGKADGDFWRRNLPSLGESQSQWNKPRSDLPSTPGKDSRHQPPFTKHLQSPKEVIFVRGLARDVTEMDIRTDVSNCGLWAKDVRVVHANDTGVSRGLAFITFNSVDEATRWMELRRCVLNLRPNNHAVMEYSNPILKDWECVRCLIVNFKNRTVCYQCNRTKEDCLDGWEETCPYPTNALLLRGLNPVTSIVEISKALKSRMIAHARLDGVRMGTDAKGRPRSVCFVQLTSVTDSMTLHKSLVNEPLIIDNCQVSVAYCQLDKLPQMNTHALGSQILSNVPLVSALPPVIPPTLQSALPSNNIPVVSRTAAATVIAPAPAPAAKPVNVTTASIRSMLEGNYTEKDIPTLAQYCASAYAKNPQEQAAYIRYYTKHYKEKLQKSQAGGGK